MNRSLLSHDLAKISSDWERAVSDYLGAADLTVAQAESLHRMKTTLSVVSDAVDVRNGSAPGMFISAVSSAGTHDEVVGPASSPRDPMPAIVTNEVATLLRYSEAIDKFLDSLGNTTFAGAFVFGAVRLLLAVSIKEVKLLIRVKEKIEELNDRLQRFEIYLRLQSPSQSVTSMCVRALGNVLRFCGLATKFLKSTHSPRETILTMESVIRNLDGDVMTEIATGVAQLNWATSRMDGNIRTFDYSQSIKFSQVFMMPHQRNPHFTGREELLRLLHERLFQARESRFNHRIALYGLGGVGKTQLAIEYVYKHEALYNDIFWISASSEAGLISGFQDIASKKACAHIRNDQNPRNIAKDVLHWLRRQQGWLLVIDNLDAISVVNGLLPEVTADGGHTLITTRNRDPTSIPAEGIEVEVLPPDEALHMLWTCSKIDGVDEGTKEMYEANAIVTELGFLPLAIDQAAAYVRDSKNLFGFLPVYRKNRKRILARRGRGNSSYAESVSTTWTMSIDCLKAINQPAIKLLQLLAFMSPDGVLVDFLASGRTEMSPEMQEIVGDDISLTDALAALEMFSLVRRFNNGENIHIHRLVQAVIVDNLDEMETELVLSDVLQMGLAAFPECEDDLSREKCRRYRLQIMSILGHEEFNQFESTITNRCILTDRVASYLYQDGYFSDALKLSTITSELKSKVLGGEHPDTLMSAHAIASALSRLGRQLEASEWHCKTLAARRKALGPEHIETLESLHGLASSYSRAGRRAEAAELFEETLRIRKGVLGTHHQDTLWSMSGLASVYDRQGKSEKAVVLFQEALCIMKQVLGSDHPKTLWTVNNLACAFYRLGKLDESVHMFEEVLVLRKKVIGSTHPETAWTMHNLAVAYKRLGRWSESKDLHRDTSALRKTVLGEDHPDVLWSMQALADTLNNMGQTMEAERLQSEALEIGKHAK